MRILGIDPGLEITGYGLVEVGDSELRLLEAGIIRSSPKDKIERRLVGIHGKVIDLIRDTRPAIAVLEELYSHYRHPRTSILMGHARGIICLAIEQEKVLMVNYPTTRVKKAITGRGHASKEQVQRTIVSLLSLKELPEPVDITDALALAVTHANVYMHDIKSKINLQ